MTSRTVLFLPVVFLMPAGVALADTPFAHPSDLPKVSCDAIHYGDAYLRRYPMAPAACVDGRMLNGEKWARFNTRVFLIDYPKFITVEMLDTAGNRVSTFSFKPAPQARIVMNGKSIPFSQVELGDTIIFWKSERRLETAAMPSETTVAWQVLPPRSPATSRAISQARASG